MLTQNLEQSPFIIIGTFTPPIKLQEELPF